MKYDMICASSDLGLMLDGDKYGPDKLVQAINKDNIDQIYEKPQLDCKKSFDVHDLKKNIHEINTYNEDIFQLTKRTINEGKMPVMLGGDHSIAIATALASNEIHNNIGIIWIDAHGDFNTFETTSTGNIHGLPFAAICGYHCTEIRQFSKQTINPKNAVLIGGRAIDIPAEYNNMKDAGVTIISEEELHQKGVEAVMKEAFEIASRNTNGIHISYDLDGIDPHVAPGVSTREDVSYHRSLTSDVLSPQSKGFTETEALTIMQYIKDHDNQVKSLDLVEFNPLNDEDDKTLHIATQLVNIFTK